MKDTTVHIAIIVICENGNCSDGTLGDGCSCFPGYYGLDCENECSCVNGNCSDGILGDGTCSCFSNYYGLSCENECSCVNGNCSDGVLGDGSCTCDTENYGISCSLNCSCEEGICDSGVNGSGDCVCNMGWFGLSCSQQCESSSDVVPELSEPVKRIISQQTGLSLDDICVFLSETNSKKRQEEVEIEIVVHYNEENLSEEEREDLRNFSSTFSEEEFSSDLEESIEGVSVSQVVIFESLIPQNPSSSPQSESVQVVEWYEEAWFWIILICGAVLILLIPIILIAKGILIDKEK